MPLSDIVTTKDQQMVIRAQFGLTDKFVVASITALMFKDLLVARITPWERPTPSGSVPTVDQDVAA